ACEEASLFMVKLFYDGEPEGLLDPNRVEDELLKLTEFETAIFGYHEDTTIDQTAILAEQFYGATFDLVDNPSVEDPKRILASGRQISIQAGGSMLKNPFFTGIGPDYHLLVIRGYTETGFITNDPGTRRGQGYVYDQDLLVC